MAAGHETGGFTTLSISTHSHPKVAAAALAIIAPPKVISTHSHPKVAAYGSYNTSRVDDISTHSHPKVAA